MQTRLVILTVALLLGSRSGSAQTPQTPQPPQSQPPVPTSLFTGTLDVGGLFTTVEGDQARYERYRDARDGVYSTFSLNRASDSYLFDANAVHVGYRDQRYAASVESRRVNAAFQWVSLPLNYSFLTRTPYVTNGNTLTLDDNAQRAVQGPSIAPADGTAVGVPCAPGAAPASCSTPALAAQALANRSIYNSIASAFDLRQQRNTGQFAMNYMPTRAIDVNAGFQSWGRDGQQPWGASFAFNNAVEVPKPLDDRTNNVSLAASWAKPRGMFRVGWDGSWFTNHNKSLVWDNPIFLTDFNNGLLPPNGPYDPNGYSNGNGPAQGRESTAPNNVMQVVSAIGLYKMPRRTTLNGTIQLTSQKQDEALIPFTINSVINSPVVFAAFPHIAQLPRPTAEAEARGINTLINLTSRTAAEKRARTATATLR